MTSRANVDDLAERAVAMARVAPEDAYAGLADRRSSSRAIFPISTCSIPIFLPSRCWSSARKRPKPPALRSKGVSKSGGASASAGIGGMVLVTSHGFHGAYLSSRQGVSMTAIAGDGTAMERDYDYSSRHPRCRSRFARAHRAQLPASARSRGSIRARFPPARCPSCSTAGSPARWSVISRAPPMAARSRARRASSGTSWASACSSPASASSTIRCAAAASARARSTARASPANRSR